MDNLTQQLRRVLAMAAIESERDGSGHVGVEHVLVALHQEGANVGRELFDAAGLTIEDMRALDWSKAKRVAPVKGTP